MAIRLSALPTGRALLPKFFVFVLMFLVLISVRGFRIHGTQNKSQWATLHLKMQHELVMSGDGSVSLVTDFGLDGRRSNPKHSKIYLFSAVSRTALGVPTIILSNGHRGQGSQSVKPDHLSTSSAEVRKQWSCIYTSPVFMS
jgi:hypothetical protein